MWMRSQNFFYYDLSKIDVRYTQNQCGLKKKESNESVWAEMYGDFYDVEKYIWAVIDQQLFMLSRNI